MRGRAIECPSGFEAAEAPEPPRGAGLAAALAVKAEHLFRAQRQRDVEAASDLEAIEARGRDADNLDRPIAEGEGAPDGRRIPAVGALPERMAQDRSRRAPRPCVVGREEPALR